MAALPPPTPRPVPTHGSARRRLPALLAAASLAGAAVGLASSPAHAAGGGPAVAQQATTTDAPTTAAPTTAPTTAAPTTAPPTAAPTTTTTRATTTSSSTTTTTMPTTTTSAPKAGDDGAPVALILLLIGLVGAAIVGAVIALTNRRSRMAAASRQVLTDLSATLTDIEMTRDLAQSHVQTNNPQPFSQVLTPRFENLRDRLTAVAGRTEDGVLRQQVNEVGETLLSFGFAAEAEWLLRRGSTPPTAEQLSLAGSTTYDRRAALDRTVGALRTTIAQRRGPR